MFRLCQCSLVLSITSLHTEFPEKERQVRACPHCPCSRKKKSSFMCCKIGTIEGMSTVRGTNTFQQDRPGCGTGRCSFGKTSVNDLLVKRTPHAAGEADEQFAVWRRELLQRSIKRNSLATETQDTGWSALVNTPHNHNWIRLC
jgi:hypothetical protein